MKEWSNWSGSLRFTPGQILEPEHTDELMEIVSNHFHSGRKIKLAAAGHSSTPLVKTPETLLQLHRFRILSEPGKGTTSFSFKFTCKEDQTGWAGDVLPKNRELRFDEMEYALPREAGMQCFAQIRRRIKERHRQEVAWRVLFRTIAMDENYLSPHSQRDGVSISLHHNAGLPFESYFSDIEPIFRDHGGRPHWAKKHNLKANELKPLYPQWHKFHACRKRLDPTGFYLNKYLMDLFGND